ncbi:ribosome hibernation promotion factor [Paludibaculum fermentans]|uniref:Ribosome hibernation promoting factor n=1 Tax=Paludibaculum fermentans TaxID=1473598 RepID=A0A7S7NLZ1_PALFE|nr:HPF/RaiA family ribosome-associated protein [Paludibaculum fermentans]QOY86081.1 HPF/RaiA family ribosome-associated protein [Paludibaculum fermentans]
MKITFTGKQDKLNPSQERKLAMAFSRLSKLLERRGEKEAQVILSVQRHLQHAEVRVNFYDHTLVGAGAATDQFAATMEAVDKVEKQALKNREKWRDTKRDGTKRTAAEIAEPLVAVPAAKPAKASKAKPVKSKPAKVVKANGKSSGKPMTVDEAMIAMEEDRDYMVFRDCETDKVSVLIRRRDGKVDLVEA